MFVGGRPVKRREKTNNLHLFAARARSGQSKPEQRIAVASPAGVWIKPAVSRYAEHRAVAIRRQAQAGLPNSSHPGRPRGLSLLALPPALPPASIAHPPLP